MKIDVSKINGYNEMTAEEKLKALEELEIEVLEQDFTGYVKKEVFDKTASELAAKKRELKAKMTEDEQKELERIEKQEKLEREYQALLKEKKVAEQKAKFLGLGYDEELANDTANALVDGDMEKVIENQKAFIDGLEKKVKSDLINGTPKPKVGVGSKVMTLERLRAMAPEQRLQFSKENPEEYKQLYEK